MRMSFFVIIIAIIAGVIYFLNDNGTEVENIRSDVSKMDFDEHSKAKKQQKDEEPAPSFAEKIESSIFSKPADDQAAQQKSKTKEEMLEESRDALKKLSSKKNKDPQDYKVLLNAAVTGNEELSPVIRAYVYMASVIIGSEDLGNDAKSGASAAELEKMAKEWATICPKCRGTEFVACPVCRGKGTIMKKENSGLGKDGSGRFTLNKETTKTVTVRCESCDGKGKMKCSFCSDGKSVTFPDVKTSKKNIGNTKKKALALLDKAIAAEK